MDEPDHETPEGRLEAFCQALEQRDPILFPPQYNTEDHTPFTRDMRLVLQRLQQAERVFDHG